MSITKNRSARLDCRISAEDKVLLELAAKKSGLRLTDFIISTMLLAAREVVQEDEPIRLARADWDAFVAELGADTSPSPRFTAAMERFKQGKFVDGRYHG